MTTTAWEIKYRGLSRTDFIEASNFAEAARLAEETWRPLGPGMPDATSPEAAPGAPISSVRALSAEEFENLVREPSGAEAYGLELVLDLHGCNVGTFTRDSLQAYFARLCDVIDMQRCDLHFWDDVGVAVHEQQYDPKTVGTSAVQFILTSNVTVHTLDLLRAVYVNVFSCKAFDVDAAARVTKAWFEAEYLTRRVLERR